MFGRKKKAADADDKAQLGGDYVRVETPRASDGDALVRVKAEGAKPSPDTQSERSTSKESDTKKKETKKNGPPKSFKFGQLYRFATAYDKFLLAVGVFMASANGALFPLMAIVFGNVLNGF
ncbi:hypothetical protein PybrP1_003334, partial [[Pythium] brassicae (nom. inval.)]